MKFRFFMPFAWSVLAALIGAPILLGLWQLAIYPAVIGGLILFWMYLEHKAKKDPNHALGFLDHGHMMLFSFWVGLPAFLFLFGWTVYLVASGVPVLKKIGIAIGVLVALAFVFSNQLGKLSDSLFAAMQKKKRVKRRTPKRRSAIFDLKKIPLPNLFGWYSRFEAKLTTGVSGGGESEGTRTQFRETVFHFRLLMLNAAVFAIRIAGEDTAHWHTSNSSWLTYLQVVGAMTSLVGWLVYLGKSGSGVPIIEPGNAFAVYVFGFGGGLLLATPITALIHAQWTEKSISAAVISSIAVVFAVLFFILAWRIADWLHHKLEWRDKFFKFTVAGLWYALVHAALTLSDVVRDM